MASENEDPLRISQISPGQVNANLKCCRDLVTYIAKSMSRILQVMADRGAVIITGSGNAEEFVEGIRDTKLDGYPALLAEAHPDPNNSDIRHVPELIVVGAIDPSTNAIWPGTRTNNAGIPEVYAPGASVWVANGNKGAWQLDPHTLSWGTSGGECIFYHTFMVALLTYCTTAAAMTVGLAAYLLRLGLNNQLQLYKPDLATPLDLSPAGIKALIVDNSWARLGFDTRGVWNLVTNSVIQSGNVCEYSPLSPGGAARNKIRQTNAACLIPTATPTNTVTPSSTTDLATPSSTTGPATPPGTTTTDSTSSTTRTVPPGQTGTPCTSQEDCGNNTCTGVDVGQCRNGICVCAGRDPPSSTTTPAVTTLVTTTSAAKPVSTLIAQDLKQCYLGSPQFNRDAAAAQISAACQEEYFSGHYQRVSTDGSVAPEGSMFSILVLDTPQACPEGRSLRGVIIGTLNSDVCNEKLLTVLDGCPPFTGSQKSGGILWADCLSWELRIDDA